MFHIISNVISTFYLGACVYVCVYACVYACVCVCVYVCYLFLCALLMKVDKSRSQRKSNKKKSAMKKGANTNRRFFLKKKKDKYFGSELMRVEHVGVHLYHSGVSPVLELVTRFYRGDIYIEGRPRS